MTARRTAATAAFLAVGPLALAGLTATPAVAHGSMTDPVSRVSACFAEGPEHPRSAACKALVAAGGTQPLYDWNEVNIGDAAGNHRRIIPDGKLCSANRAKYRGLDLPRTDWPSSSLTAGKHTFHYKATAPHKGTFELYLTKAGYDPSKPLKWSDLEAKPFVKVTNPKLVGGEYVFDGTVPARSGRHLVYSIWQRSDSPEAFYTCSDVVFGGKGGAKPGAPAAAAPSDRQIEAGTEHSTVDHGGHGGDASAHGSAHGQHQAPAAAPAPAKNAGEETGEKAGELKAAESPAGQEAQAAQGAGDPAKTAAGQSLAGDGGNAPQPQGAAEPVAAPATAPATENLAQTGGDSTTPYLAVGGAAVLATGAAVLFASTRRRAGAAGRDGR
ncbi:lytic polysaccharide monooxygenase [Streptomyces sp. LP05-1]|uniref:Lytic polysaccharide monooxygenase n=1 Tax=Streptomyces pyxinae TaxID=2970734 RepID=A0ABT2CLU2_9ACTN|nr:lytic polysaccharide monooxygenase [Streptomyces sp. LP05-1]MCS0638377.1 lytic polysaccharide monooxygenase [Streptomyces sp. LP05-1]